VTKYLRKSTERKKVLFWLVVAGFSLWSLGSIVSGSCEEEQHGGEEVGWGRGWRQDIPFKGMSPVTSFLQLGPT
jgi:hypothetical protein